MPRSKEGRSTWMDGTHDRGREGVTSRLTVLSCSAEYEESWNPFVFKVGSVEYSKRKGRSRGRLGRSRPRCPVVGLNYVTPDIDFIPPLLVVLRVSTCIFGVS